MQTNKKNLTSFYQNVVIVLIVAIFLIGLIIVIFKKKSQNLMQALVLHDELIVDNSDVSNMPTTGATIATTIATTTATTIDSELQSVVYASLEDVARRFLYVGGAGVVMDIGTGEVIALVSYPEPDLLDTIGSAHLSEFNRATVGLYAPGSAIKPFVAIGALAEGIIKPDKQILSTGSIQLPNPYQTGSFFIFRDWKAHGYVDMRKAIGVSSNVYFYEISGGFEEQEGLGIDRLEKYLRMFGFASTTGIDLISEKSGAIPNPKWKEQKFGDEWRVGDTYLASIGQHGYEVTPLQMVRAVATIANGGKLITPTLQRGKAKNKNSRADTTLPIKEEYFQVVREGMEYAVTNGTASGLYLDDFTLSAKTGTVEVDVQKQFIHTWVIGYFPHDNPRYAFTFMLESGPWGTETGAVAVADGVFKWIQKNRQQYYNGL